MTTGAADTSPLALRIETVDRIAVVTFDLPGEQVNKISRRVIEEFRALFDRIETDPGISAVVLESGKPDVWIAGADIEEFLLLQSASEAEKLSREGQALLQRLEDLRTPVVAAIHGACLGGGLETALACAHRVATDHPKTIFALPEVQLGLIPGAGGTQRLPRMIGLPDALDMILTGKNVRGKKALKIGLVDELVHPAILREIALRRAREFAEKSRARSRGARSRGLAGAVLNRTALGRRVVFRKARASVVERTHGNYPAPMAALEAVEGSYSLSRDDAYRNEARLFGEVASTSVSRQLIYLFFASNALKRDPGVQPPAPQPLPVRKAGVLGAGFMGAGIAGLAAQNGIVVRLKDAEHDRVAKGLAAVRSLASERLRRRHITRQQLDDELSLITGTIDYSGFAKVDLVVEAVFEDLQVKQQVLREVERELGERAIFATNTSTIPVASIAEASARPDRVIGMHFFSPVHKMPLLEVVVTPRTDPEVVVTAVECGRKLGKTVIVVNDGPGFYVNRILAPYINEAGKLLDQGASIDSVDDAMVKFGFPVGPFTLIDEVGLDIVSKAGAVMSAALGARLSPARAHTAVVNAGRQGRKNKSGFYTYDDKGTKGSADETIYDLLGGGRERADISPAEIEHRLVYGMLNEAALCLEDGVLRSARDGDVGAVFGIGFPPFRGGPFRYMDSLGITDLVRELEELNQRFPGRFEPADMLVHMSRRGERFHTAG